MTETLRIASSIGTPLALVGFLLALTFYAYLRWLGSQEKKLEMLPADERSKAEDRYLTRYKIDGGNLTRDQKYQLIRHEMVKGDRFNRFWCVTVAVVFLICFLLAGIIYYISPTPSPAPVAPTNTSLRLKMEKKGVMTSTEEKLGAHFSFTLSNPTTGLAIIKSVELEVLEVMPDPYPVSEAQVATYKYEVTLNPQKKGTVSFAKGLKYAPGEVDQFALNVYSAPEGYDYFVRVVVKWDDAVSDQERTTSSEVMVARFPKGLGGEWEKAALHKEKIQERRDQLQLKLDKK